MVFFNILTGEMVNDLNDTHHKKPSLALQTSKSLTHTTDNPLEDFCDNQTKSINNPTGNTFSPPYCTKRPKRIHMTIFSLFPERKQFHQPKLIIKLPPFILTSTTPNIT